ncbi:type IX secretion system membrane protein PorP/SprF [Flavobacterium sp. Fl-77]|uniref:Type IX secretion system membrane protein PorP/SprF n=1 Tax=Flavobacterium flavipigmentatum TaxID=2893884 RepID=A0AAJ2S5W5_9FLAO|nr:MULTISPECIES: type IX secretion system membrane protein PorP/SprF [unclassified Flavobacterium]MDX6181878.1 type IX secretion system membrane protein PorP/SprF [Flavobacterium sp. Fl-33]MDX6185088.1 type IX secretion system membrane protein PorP/SprF [Flavobacterium sp. Fl-77]UFH37197.1 type IX secretion system membrane protein PorP/SprF [Flavobacterium sp. F-70]
MKKTLLFISFLFYISSMSAQQDPEYTHYMYNMSVVNPAYATGTAAMLNVGGLYRTQWVGAVGAPKTFTFFGHTALSDKIELGASLISDDIGDGAKKENNFYADFAYVLKLAGRHKLSLGLKAGFTSLQTNFNGFVLQSGNVATDLAFAENINVTRPNIGVGAYYFTDTYYVGLSVPNLLNGKHIEEKSGINAYGAEEIHGFLTAGYVFKISDSFKLKPAFMSKFVGGSPISFDVTANVLYHDKFEFGAAYRVDDAVSALMNINITPSLRVGYAYDHTLSNLGQFNSGTHEIMLLFNLDLLGKGYDKSPRFF